MSTYKRSVKILKSNSFFLFGARATGKTALLKEEFGTEDTLWLDLLDSRLEAQLTDNPGYLTDLISARKKPPAWVILDEIQKVPKLLDVVHRETESRHIKFGLTGSNARKLKRGGANLLAGRALVNHLFPLTHRELAADFNLLKVLTFGSLPFVTTCPNDLVIIEYLESYVQTYLKEEILQEQIIRNVTPFRKFIAIAAQLNGTLLNFQAIANDLGVDWASIRNYFEILEDTLLGFLLPSFDRSLRKQQLKASKFYLFDLGVRRTLDRTIVLRPETGQQIGPLFEHFILCEIFRLNQYSRNRFSLSHIATKGGLEVDLVIERPGLKTVLVEIKSTSQVTEHHLRHLLALKTDYPEFEAYCLCQEALPRNAGGIKIFPWQQGLEELGF